MVPPAALITGVVLFALASSEVRAAPAPPEVRADGISAFVLTLDEARRRALASNPELLLLETEVDAARATRRALVAWANPEVGVELENFGGDLDRWNDSETTWSVTQSLGNPGGWLARRRLGQVEIQLAREQFEAGRLDLLAEVERRYGAALAAAGRLQVAIEGREIADTLLLAVRALSDAGEVSPIEVERMRTERARAGARLSTLEGEAHRACLELAWLWGDSAVSFDGMEGSLDAAAPLPDPAEVRTRPPARSDRARLETAVMRARAEAGLAAVAWLPSFEAGAGLRRFNESGDRAWTASLGLSLPLFDQGQGERRGREARVRAAEIELRSGLARARSEREAAWAVLQATDEASRGMRDEALPAARAAFEAVQEGYRRGKFGLVDLLDARRARLETREESLEADLARWNARVELERSLGASLRDAAGEE